VHAVGESSETTYGTITATNDVRIFGTTKVDRSDEVFEKDFVFSNLEAKA
jgi:hypothetical protein